MAATDKRAQLFTFEAELKSLFRDASLRRITSAISHKDSISICEIENPDDFIYGQWMSLILLSGPAMQVTLKTHYFNRDAVQLVAWALQKKPDEIQPNVIMDFMREFLNLTSGEVKATLATVNIPVGLSLPLISRGFDEVLFSDVVNERNLLDWWALVGKFGKLVCTMEIEVFQPDGLKNITKIDFSAPKDQGDEGDVDFL